MTMTDEQRRGRRVDRQIGALCRTLQCEPAGLLDAVRALKDREAALRQQLRDLDRMASQPAETCVCDLGGQPVIVTSFPEADRGFLRAYVDAQVDILPCGAVVVALGVWEGEAAIVGGATQDAVDAGANAGRAVRWLAQAAGGNGGGRPRHAEGGGCAAARLMAVIDSTRAQRENGPRGAR